jgi:hypothetical protein
MLEIFLRSYIDTALWSSTGGLYEGDQEPLDKSYDKSDLSPASLAAMRGDCAKFCRENEDLLWKARTEDGQDYARQGHDFWLTRNHHGAGFWDGDYPSTGEALTEAAHAFGEADLYVGDDGYVYQSGAEDKGRLPIKPRYQFDESDRQSLKSMGIMGSKRKSASFAEEQWEDALLRKGWHVDNERTGEHDWEDDIWTHNDFPHLEMRIHEGTDGSWFEAREDGQEALHGDDTDELWRWLSDVEAAGEAEKEAPVFHGREPDERDLEDLEEMGVRWAAKSPLLWKNKGRGIRGSA